MANTNIEKLPTLLRQEADRIVTRTCFYAAGIGLIPVPLADAALILGVQMLMIKQIGDVFGVPFKKQIVKSLIGSLAGNLGAVGAVKFIPGLGTTLGAAAVSVGGVAVTYALGQVFMQHFARGGDIDDFQAEDWKESFQSHYQNKVKEEEQNGQEKGLDNEKKAILLKERQLSLQAELERIQVEMKNLKAKKIKNKKVYWFRMTWPKMNAKWLAALGIILALVLIWFFRDTFLIPGEVRDMMEESVATLDSLQHAIGVDSLVANVSEQLDTLVSEVSTEMDSLVNEVATEVDSLNLDNN